MGFHGAVRQYYVYTYGTIALDDAMTQTAHAISDLPQARKRSKPHSMRQSKEREARKNTPLSPTPVFHTTKYDSYSRQSAYHLPIIYQAAILSRRIKCENKKTYLFRSKILYSL